MGKCPHFAVWLLIYITLDLPVFKIKAKASSGVYGVTPTSFLFNIRRNLTSLDGEYSIRLYGQRHEKKILG